MAARTAGAQDVTGLGPSGAFRFERRVIVREAGPNRLPIDLDLLAGGRPFEVVDEPLPGTRGTRKVARGGLRDLRLYDAAGAEIPYLVVMPPAPEPNWIDARPTPIPASERASGFEIDLGRLEPVDALRIDGLPAPFLKRVGLQASGDRHRWIVVARQATVFDLPDQQLAWRDIEFPPGEYRFLRVIWDDTNSARVPLPGRVSARRVEPDRPQPVPLRFEVTVERRPSEPRRSRFRLLLPAARLPVVSIAFDARDTTLLRQVAALQSRFSGQDAEPVVIGRGMLRRRSAGAASASDLRIPISPLSSAVIDLVVDDGDNPPIDLRGATVECALLPWIYFDAPGDRGVVARYGRPGLDAPVYDLEVRRSDVHAIDAAPAMWGPPREAVPAARDVGSAMPRTGAVIDLAGFRYARAVADGPPALVSIRADAALLAHSAGPDARFRDVRIVDAQNRQIPYLVERLDEPTRVLLPSLEPVSGQPPRGEGGRVRPGTSIYRVPRPLLDLPRATLVLTTPARVFDRNVRVVIERPGGSDRTDGSGGVPLVLLANGRWSHADPEAAAPDFGLALPQTTAMPLFVEIDDGDNSPLPLSGAQLLLPGYRLRFYRPSPGPLRLVYGHREIAEPRYDLRLLSSVVLEGPAVELATGSEEVVESAMDDRALDIPPAVYYGVLALAVVVIGGLIARLLRTRR